MGGGSRDRPDRERIADAVARGGPGEAFTAAQERSKMMASALATVVGGGAAAGGVAAG